MFCLNQLIVTMVTISQISCIGWCVGYRSRLGVYSWMATRGRLGGPSV